MLLTEEQTDALQELVNIGVGRAASLLSEMVNLPVKLCVPVIKVIRITELEKELSELAKDDISAVKLDFDGTFSGVAEIVFPSVSAAKLISILTGEEVDSPDIDSLRSGTLCEIGNIVLNAVVGSLGNLLDERFLYSIPSYHEMELKSIYTNTRYNLDHVILLGKTRFEIATLSVEGEIILLLELAAIEKLKEAISKII